MQNGAPDKDGYIEWLDGLWGTRSLAPHNPEVRLRIAVLLWPDFALMSLTGVLESLRHSGDYGDNSEQRYVRWRIVGEPGSKVRSSCGIEVAATHAYAAPSEFDFVVVIGGLLKNFDAAPAAHRAFIHSARRAGCGVVGVCTGSVVLAQERLLDGRLVCVHPYVEADFKEAFPGLRLSTRSDFEGRNGVFTVAGGISILSFMTRLIRDHLGPDRAAKAVHQMSVTGLESLGQLDRTGLFRHLEVTDPRIQKALVSLEKRASENPKISEIAASIGLTERHFLRLFRAQVGMSPKSFLISMKLKAAIWMLRNTSKSVSSIAYSSGFSSSASLTGHCAKKLKATPSEIRNSR
ncbi:MAG: GlxA family transcriptional regulator [Neomegalonema sp.]